MSSQKAKQTGARPFWMLVWMLAFGMVVGCGGPSDQPDLGSVSGTVTLDGKPLANATVMFQPEQGRPSYGVTDDDGYYELRYTANTDGAVVGKHVVSITTYEDPEEEGQKPTPEKVPVDYNENAAENPEMNVEVKSGSQTFDFNLTTEGKEIVQPAEDDDGGY